MCSFLSPFPLYLSSHFRLLRHHKLTSSSSSNRNFIRPRNYGRPFYISASVAQKDLDFSWVSSEQNDPNDYNGWAVVEAPVKPRERKKGATLVMIVVGASLAALLGVVAYHLISKKDFQFRFIGPFNTTQGISLPSKTEEKAIDTETIKSDGLKDEAEISEGTQEIVSDGVDDSVLIEPKKNVTRPNHLGRIMVSVDSTQQEALHMLQKLKIIEDDVKADELCTRREYARWLVRANSQLERSQRHRILSSAALSGSTVMAFDDVNVEDPDFVHIQCLAEAGIVASRLLDGNFALDLNDSDGQQGVFFLPDRFISRQDLISWKAKLEYEVIPGLSEEFRYQGRTLVFLM